MFIPFSLTTPLILVFLRIYLVEALGLTSQLGVACLYVANNYTDYNFDCPPPDPDYTCRCKNQPFMGTVLTCIDNGANSVEIVTEAYHFLKNTCLLQGKIDYSFDDLVGIFENATEYLVDYRWAKIYTSFNGTISNPASTDPEMYNISINSASRLINHRKRGIDLG